MRTMSTKDTHSKHKKTLSKGPRTPPTASSSRSTLAKKGAAPEKSLPEKMPIIIATEQQGDKPSSNPRTWRAPAAVQPHPEDSE